MFKTGVNVPGARFSKAPKLFGPVKPYCKISNLTITELFYSQIPNMTRGSLYTRGFRHIFTSLSLDTDELNITLRARKVSGGFEKRAPVP